ncbi:dynamin family protein [Rothia sp. ZJ932]|uniref:dynamin family protein n=1 Tax=Rothia sp. ZJ932 TaxID=2810516 RepID=UPI001F086279|nr:dynamin family protein [Rothia sp. ZJ932]
MENNNQKHNAHESEPTRLDLPLNDESQDQLTEVISSLELASDLSQSWAVEHSAAAPVDESVAEDLRQVRTATVVVKDLSFPLETTDAPGYRTQLRKTATQLDDYVLPKLASVDSPLTVVIGGSTGAGKSTLVNTLIGKPVTRSGAIRPTTRQPVLLHRPEDAAAYAPERILPHLVRVHAENGRLPGADPHTGVDQLIMMPEEEIPAGIALIDAPDIDSVSEDNRRLAKQLLSAADLWLFVTTANRYADAVPWELLNEAATRDITVAVVLNRVPEGGEDEIEEDLRRMLADAGIEAAFLMTVIEQERDEQGLISPASVVPLIYWLRELGADSAQRSQIARKTLEGALRSIAAQTRSLQKGQSAQYATAQHLRTTVGRAYEDAYANIHAATQDGSLLRGEVLSRWQDFVGTGEFFRSLETSIGRLRDRIAGFFNGQPTQAAPVEEALEVGLHAIILEEAAKAAETSQRRWLDEPAGRALLAGDDLGQLHEGFSGEVAESIRAWQQDIMDLIQREGADKRQKARFMSLGLNATAVVLMVAVFSMTGGLTGLEVGIAGGSGVVGQKLLEAIFGEDAVRRMTKAARESLEARIREVLSTHQQRFDARLDAVDLGPEPAVVEQAAGSLEIVSDSMTAGGTRG